MTIREYAKKVRQGEKPQGSISPKPRIVIKSAESGASHHKGLDWHSIDEREPRDFSDAVAEFRKQHKEAE
jgi:hypothetical protein